MEERGKRPAAAEEQVSDGAPLLPGLPDEIATLCLARVPSLILLWRVCPSWQRLISASPSFHSLRHSFGFRAPLWLYVLLHNSATQTTDLARSPIANPSSSFSWHAFDPISHQWHSLPPLPQPLDFQLTSPSFIGLIHAVQCASSSTKIFMVAGSRRRRHREGVASRDTAATGHSNHSPASSSSSSSSNSQLSSSATSAVGSDLFAESTSAAVNSPPPPDERYDNGEDSTGSGRSSESLWRGKGGGEAVIVRKKEEAAGSEIGVDDEEWFRRKPLEPALDRPLVFDTRSRKWSWGPAFRVPRKWCACGTLGEKLVVASGCGEEWDMALSGSAEMYDPDVDAACQRWVALDQLRSTKFSGEAITAVAFRGKLHMVSGTGVFRRAGVMYDPATSTWLDMPKGMRNGWNGPTVVVDGKLLALDDSSGRLKCYDEARDGWATVIQDEMLIGMEQLSSGGGGRFCGIVRRQAYEEDDGRVQWRRRRHRPPPPESDVVRMVDIRDEKKPAFKDVPVPFGRIVALQALSRTFLPI